VARRELVAKLRAARRPEEELFNHQLVVSEVNCNLCSSALSGD
jgi:hypothetical protein